MTNDDVYILDGLTKGLRLLKKPRRSVGRQPRVGRVLYICAVDILVNFWVFEFVSETGLLTLPPTGLADLMSTDTLSVQEGLVWLGMVKVLSVILSAQFRRYASQKRQRSKSYVGH